MNREENKETPVSLEEQAGRLLLKHDLSLATAESCTGGQVGHLLTNIPGSSAYFLGGIISYDNSIKEKVLGVPATILETVGAVSQETALAMARGTRDLLKADLGLSTTGIAGPGGASPGKPVGLVYIALAGPEGFERCERYIWDSDRVGNKDLSARAALQMLLDYLIML